VLTRRSFCGRLVGGALGAGLGCSRGEAARVAIALLPLAPAPSAAEIAAARSYVRELFSIELLLLGGLPLSASAQTAPRDRHRADLLLRELAARRPARAAKILGVTAGDISTTKGEHADWGVFGLSELGGSAAVVSAFRLRRAARDASHASERFARVCAHELGHAFGSPHCAAHRCLMADARGSVRAIDRAEGFCAQTHAVLGARGAPLPSR